MRNRLCCGYKTRVFLFVGYLIAWLNGYPETTDTLQVHFTVYQCDSLIQANAANPDFAVMDVRTPAEYIPEHLEGAINRNYYDPGFVGLLDELPRHKMYVIHCLSGSRSGSTFVLMVAMGFTKVVNMLGGISAWKTAGLPVTSLFSPLQMAVSDTLVPNDTVYIGSTDTIRLTVTNRANDTLRFTGITSLSGTEYSTDFDTSTTLEGPFDYTFSVLYTPTDETTDALDFLIESNGGSVLFHIWRTGKMPVGLQQLTIYNLQLTIYPDPVVTLANINFHLDKDMLCGITLLNQSGQVVDRFSYCAKAGKNQVLWDAGSLPAGIYFCRITGGRYSGTGKLIKY